MGNAARLRGLVAYDVASDGRRERIAELLSAYGPRVQLSVFEVEFSTTQERTRLWERLRAVMDPDQDQVRMYVTDADAAILGTRTMEERAAYWVISPVGSGGR